MADAYDMIDRFLRNNLDDSDYARYSEALDAVAAPTPHTPMDMALCEAHRVVLRVGQPYTFRPVGDCETCARMAADAREAYGETMGAPAGVQGEGASEALTDEQCDELSGATYRALRKTGWDGGMGSLQWDRALVRAAAALAAPVQQAQPPAPGVPTMQLTVPGRVYEDVERALNTFQQLRGWRIVHECMDGANKVFHLTAVYAGGERRFNAYDHEPDAAAPSQPAAQPSLEMISASDASGASPAATGPLALRAEPCGLGASPSVPGAMVKAAHHAYENAEPTDHTDFWFTRMEDALQAALSSSVMPPDFAKVLYENLWDLYATGEQPARGIKPEGRESAGPSAERAEPGPGRDAPEKC